MTNHAYVVVRRMVGAGYEINWDDRDSQRGILEAIGAMPLHELGSFSAHLRFLTSAVENEMIQRSLTFDNEGTDYFLERDQERLNSAKATTPEGVIIE